MISPPFTDEQLEILRLLAHGSPIDAIATSVHLSPRMARTRVTEIVSTLGAQNPIHAACIAAANGWVRIQEPAGNLR